MLTVSILKKKFLLFTFNRFVFPQKLRLQKENYDKLYVTLFSVYLQKVAELFQTENTMYQANNYKISVRSDRYYIS